MVSLNESNLKELTRVEVLNINGGINSIIYAITKATRMLLETSTFQNDTRVTR